MADAKKLTMTAVRDEYRKYKETTTIRFYANNEVYKVTIYPFFKPERIDNVVLKLREDIAFAEDNGMKIPDNLFFPFVLYQTIREFTDISTPKNPKTNIQFFRQFYNTYFFQRILDTMIPTEVEKVYQKVLDMIADSQKLENLNKQLEGELNRLELENPEIKDSLAKVAESWDTRNILAEDPASLLRH